MSNSPKISASAVRQRNAFAIDVTCYPNASCLWFCSLVQINQHCFNWGMLFKVQHSLFYFVFYVLSMILILIWSYRHSKLYVAQDLDKTMVFLGGKKAGKIVFHEALGHTRGFYYFIILLYKEWVGVTWDWILIFFWLSFFLCSLRMSLNAYNQ